MPASPRIKGKVTEIAYKIIGVPSNISHDKERMKERDEKREEEWQKRNRRFRR